MPRTPKPRKTSPKRTPSPRPSARRSRWNPVTEPARSVKRVLIETGARVEVIPERTMKDLGLASDEVQVAMNTEFFSGSRKRLSEAQCGPNIAVATLVSEIIQLQNA